jgi:hypothetical protein
VVKRVGVTARHGHKENQARGQLHVGHHGFSQGGQATRCIHRHHSTDKCTRQGRHPVPTRRIPLRARVPVRAPVEADGMHDHRCRRRRQAGARRRRGNRSDGPSRHGTAHCRAVEVEAASLGETPEQTPGWGRVARGAGRAETRGDPISQRLRRGARQSVAADLRERLTTPTALTARNLRRCMPTLAMRHPIRLDPLTCRMGLGSDP